MTVAAADPSERPLRVRAGEIELKLWLNTKWLHKPFRDAVLLPFIKAYNAKTSAAMSIELVKRVELDGQKLPSKAYSQLTDELVVGDKVRCAITFGELSEPEPPRPARTPSAHDQAHERFYRRVEMKGEHALLRADELAWSNKNLKAEDMESFLQICREKGPLPHVASCYFYGNWLGCSGMEPLSQALQLLPGLRNLYLQSNEIGNRGVRFLCDNPPPGELTQLALWRNDIDNEGFLVLAEALKAGRLRVRTLVIHGNRATFTGKDALEAACTIMDVRVQT